MVIFAQSLAPSNLDSVQLFVNVVMYEYYWLA